MLTDPSPLLRGPLIVAPVVEEAPRPLLPTRPCPQDARDSAIGKLRFAKRSKMCCAVLCTPVHIASKTRAKLDPTRAKTSRIALMRYADSPVALHSLRAQSALILTASTNPANHSQSLPWGCREQYQLDPREQQRNLYVNLRLDVRDHEVIRKFVVSHIFALQASVPRWRQCFGFGHERWCDLCDDLIKIILLGLHADSMS